MPSDHRIERCEDATMDEIKGRVHSFESFGGVDGKGIRYVIFLQGCTVGCTFCHNSDTWDVRGGTEFTVAEIAKKVEGCKPYLTLSNGGVTISGGEPLSQPRFVAALFRRCREMGINTAIDTSACGTRMAIDLVSEDLDLFLISVKHTTDSGHRQLTAFERKEAWENIRYIDTKSIPIWVRFVVIPGITDSEEVIRALGKFVGSLSNVRRIELIPYHTLGAHKWRDHGMKNRLEGIMPANNEHMDRAAAIMRRYFSNVVV